jgi:hypothetical protein
MRQQHRIVFALAALWVCFSFSKSAICSLCLGQTFQDEANQAACKATRVCSAAEYESVAATVVSDRTCTALRTCGAGQYVLANATLTSDRVCDNCTSGLLDVSFWFMFSCSIKLMLDTFHEGPNAAFCRATTVCNGVQFESVGATLTTDRTCTNLLNCSAGQQIGTNATATSDRICINCSLGSFAVYFSCSMTPKGLRSKTRHFQSRASQRVRAVLFSFNPSLRRSLQIALVTHFESVQLVNKLLLMPL